MIFGALKRNKLKKNSILKHPPSLYMTKLLREKLDYGDKIVIGVYKFVINFWSATTEEQISFTVGFKERKKKSTQFINRE